MSYSVSGTNLNAIKVFRLLKILRPLRFISRNQGLKISIRALEVAIPGIINSIIVCTLFIFIFGIIGINYFKGKLYNCDFGDLVVNQIVDDKWDCLNIGAQWKNSFLNFDNTGNSMVSIFIVSSTFEWTSIMYNVVSIRGLDLTY